MFDSVAGYYEIMEPNAEYRFLIDRLIRAEKLKTQRLIDSFLSIDRRYFVPKDLSDFAYDDSPLLIPGDQTISQPAVAAVMLEFLSVGGGDKVLEIGTGSGWQSAVMGLLVGDGLVTSLERIAEVHNFAKENIESAGLTELPIEFVKGDASRLSDALYDKIISGATSEAVPDSWKKFLKVGGRMVVPVNDCLVVADKLSADDYEIRRYFGFNFVPLVTGSRRVSG